MTSSLLMAIPAQTVTMGFPSGPSVKSRPFHVLNVVSPYNSFGLRRRESCSSLHVSDCAPKNFRSRLHHDASKGQSSSLLRRHFYCNSQLADIAPATSAVYGVLLFGGGLFAYLKSGSKGSLFGGLTGAALMGLVYVLTSTKETESIADALGFGSALLFSSIFGIRLVSTKKLTPAGPLLALSLFASIVFVSMYLQHNL